MGTVIRFVKAAALRLRGVPVEDLPEGSQTQAGVYSRFNPPAIRRDAEGLPEREETPPEWERRDLGI